MPEFKKPYEVMDEEPPFEGEVTQETVDYQKIHNSSGRETIPDEEYESKRKGIRKTPLP